MTDLPKSKRFLWDNAQIEPLPFRYEMEAALEVVVDLMENAKPWSFGVYEQFSIAIEPMHPEHRAHDFSLFLGSQTRKNSGTYAEGRIFQSTETMCVIEGVIHTRVRTLFQSLLMVGLLSLGVIVFGASANVDAICVGAALLLIVFLGINGAHPASERDRLIKLLEGLVKAVQELRHPYRLVTQSPHPRQAPKHSRPLENAEKKARRVPVVRKVDLLDMPDVDGDKSKQKRD